MEKWKRYLKYVLLFLLDMAPFVVRLVFYKGGGPLDLFVLWPCIAGLMVLNFCVLESTTVFTAFQCLMALCGRISGEISTDLYCTYVSGDAMSRTLGDGFAIVEMWIILLVTAIMIVVRVRMKRKKKTE